MPRRYSRISNYAVGQSVRMIVFFLFGFLAAWYLLPRFGLILTQNQLGFASVVVGFVCGSLAKRYT
jgi:hypothetical protein